MKTIYFNCYKIASRLSLKTIAAFFQIHSPLSWEDFIVLKGNHLNMILKRKTASRQVYLFEFGCMTFVNFSPDETRMFLLYMESIVGKINFDLFARFHEGHTIKIRDNGRFRLWKNSKNSYFYNEDVLTTIAVILAKSTALDSVEVEVGKLMDKAENLIRNLQKGRLGIKFGRHFAVSASIIRFEQSIAGSIGVFDRSRAAGRSMLSRKIYDELSGYYELRDRLIILKEKVDELRNITGNYSTISFNRQESRILLLEVFLIALFPLSHAVRYLISSHHASAVFQSIISRLW